MYNKGHYCSLCVVVIILKSEVCLSALLVCYCRGDDVYCVIACIYIYTVKDTIVYNFHIQQCLTIIQWRSQEKIDGWA